MPPAMETVSSPLDHQGSPGKKLLISRSWGNGKGKEPAQCLTGREKDVKTPGSPFFCLLASCRAFQWPNTNWIQRSGKPTDGLCTDQLSKTLSSVDGWRRLTGNQWRVHSAHSNFVQHKIQVRGESKLLGLDLVLTSWVGKSRPSWFAMTLRL